MIVCTRCGASNEDFEPLCSVCGHKLQSRRRFGAPERTPVETLRPMGKGGPAEGRFRGLLLRCAEVWAVAGALLGFALWGVSRGLWWPGLVGAALGGAYALLRR